SLLSLLPSSLDMPGRVEPAGRSIPESVSRSRYGRIMSPSQMTDVPVDVLPSQRRRRTPQARFQQGRLLARLPAGLAADEAPRLDADHVAKVRRRIDSEAVDLEKRPRSLAARYRLPRPEEIDCSSRQMRRCGSCTPADER